MSAPAGQSPPDDEDDARDEHCDRDPESNGHPLLAPEERRRTEDDEQRAGTEDRCHDGDGCPLRRVGDSRSPFLLSDLDLKIMM